MLPPLLDVAEIQNRLRAIFPEGTPHQSYVVREIAARTIFVMLYIGAVEGESMWLAPKHVYRMSESQAGKQSDNERSRYVAAVEKPGFTASRDRWFQDNTREPIRDETLRDGLVALGAVITRPGIATTSGKGRYALQKDFAALFQPKLEQGQLELTIEEWRKRFLSAGALARVLLQQHSAAAAKSQTLVTLPNGESRMMAAGPSSVITKAVIEIFAKRFLADSAVLWVSESGKKVVQRDGALARRIGLNIEADKLLPDAILVDLAPAEPLLIFVEIVASDGPITEARRTALLELVTRAKFDPRQIAFLTAFQDRMSPAFRKALPHLTWGSFAWCVSEPEHLIAMDGAEPGQFRLISDFRKLFD